MSKKDSINAWEEEDMAAEHNGLHGSSGDLATKRHQGCWPQDVGIIAMEVHFPYQYVDQTELEQFDGVSKGKYTVGLGQTRLGFVNDREDINSLCLTVLTKLVERTGIGYKSIGRLDVGTETVLDKSKSIKSLLMSTFEASGNTDVEGLDTTNACYGGTAALINAVNWVESSAWDGRYAVVIAGDIAIYASGAARPTSGTGAVAMLVAPNAPLVLDRGVRSTYMTHCYDFYKPVLSSEYPLVDGQLSILSYFAALDACYATYLTKARKHLKEDVTGIHSFKALLFHTPFCKLVQKSLARLAYNDYRNLSDKAAAAVNPDLLRFRNVPLNQTYFDKDVEKAFVSMSQNTFETKTRPSLKLATEVGNSYTASVYGALASFLSGYSKDPNSLIGERLCLFSYGSGLAATMFSIVVKPGTAPSSEGALSKGQSESGLSKLVGSLSDLRERLDSRKKVSPKDFSEILKIKESIYQLAPYEPKGSTDDLFPGAWYLTQIDEKYRRAYERLPVSLTSSASKAALASATVTKIPIPASIKI